MSRPKVYKDVPKVPVYKPNIDEFYKFMYERHMIYVRRFIQKLPPPWTDNPILRDYKFTNVYRELDRGTIWYKEHIIPKAKSQRDLLWLTVMYRLLNRVETFEKVGLVSSEFWWDFKDDWLASLKKLQKTTSIFTNAHLTLPSGAGQSKVEKYILVLDYFRKNLKKIWAEVASAKTGEDVFKTLKQIPCVGDFISYEVYCDLVLAKVISFTENDFVNPGPGCKTGLKLMFPLVTSRKEFQEKIVWLQRNQEGCFSELGLKFLYLYPNQYMTLRSIEHSLCEFSKYFKVKLGIGKQRMHFKPVTGMESGQIVFRFPR